MTGTVAFMILFIYGLQAMNFVNKSRYTTHWMQIAIQDSCVLSARISYSLYSCVQIVNVSAFDETRNVIQCKLSDELEMSRMNE